MHDVYKEYLSRSGAFSTPSLSVYVSNLKPTDHLHSEDVVLDLRMSRGITDFGTQSREKLLDARNLKQLRSTVGS